MDKRAEPRIPNEFRFFIHVLECNEDPDLIGVSIACEAADISSRGLQFKTATTLYPHSLLNITIGTGEPFAMYSLRGEIRWVKGDEPELAMGVLLQDVEGSDYQKWGEDFETLSSESSLMNNGVEGFQ